MKRLTMKKQSSGYVFQDQDTIVYRAQTTQVKNDITTSVRNAYGDEIIRITYTKPGGFRLFRTNKQTEIKFMMDGKEELLQTKGSCYQVHLYTADASFTCGNIDGDSCMVMECDGEVLARRKEAEIILKDALYSAECCAFLSFISDYKDKVLASEDTFRTKWKQAI